MLMMLVIMSQRNMLTTSDQSDTDSSSASETSDTSDIDMGLDNKDPNLHNPIVSNPLLWSYHCILTLSYKL